MLTIIVLVIIYLLSVLKMYTFFRNSFSEGGQWKYSNADLMCILFTIMPLANTIFSLMEIGNSGKEHEDRASFNSFFNVKK